MKFWIKLFSLMYSSFPLSLSFCILPPDSSFLGSAHSHSPLPCSNFNVILFSFLFFTINHLGIYFLLWYLPHYAVYRIDFGVRTENLGIHWHPPNRAQDLSFLGCNLCDWGLMFYVTWMVNARDRGYLVASHSNFRMLRKTFCITSQILYIERTRHTYLAK